MYICGCAWVFICVSLGMCLTPHPPAMESKQVTSVILVGRQFDDEGRRRLWDEGMMEHTMVFISLTNSWTRAIDGWRASDTELDAGEMPAWTPLTEFDERERQRQSLTRARCRSKRQQHRLMRPADERAGTGKLPSWLGRWRRSCRLCDKHVMSCRAWILHRNVNELWDM